jgi:hypothetical protein
MNVSHRRRSNQVQVHVEELEPRQLPSTYFVSPTGSDANPGTSSSAPWQTINRVNQATFQAGDQVLFQGGATFSGSLTFNKPDAGTPASPIVIGSYGTSPATINAGNGAGISINNTHGFTIQNLVIVGSGYATNSGDGISVVNSIPRLTLAGFTITNVDVSGFGKVGIHFARASTGGNFSGISISSSSVHDNGYGGLFIYSPGDRSANVYIGHVQAYHNAGANIIQSGYGIFTIGVNELVVEESVAHDNGWLPGNQGETGGIEALSGNRVLLQYNEAYANHKGKSDGDGIILDVTTNSVMQYNYTHDNDGAGLFLGAEIGHASSNNVVRYNISQNDARTQPGLYGGILVWRQVSNSDIYNNTVSMGPSAAGGTTAIRILTFTGSAVHVRDNIFVTTSGVPLVAYKGGGTGLVFQGNDYWSNGSSFVVQWLGTTYSSLKRWRRTTGAETLRGVAVGSQVNPQLNNVGGGGTIANTNQLDTLTAYQAQSGSSLAGGVLLQQFGIRWDPYAFARDQFFSNHFDSTPRNFYGALLPSPGSNMVSIGAEQEGQIAWGTLG